jgi:pilus assembly protein Flp/PilA
MTKLFKKLATDEQAASMAEYALLLALVSVAVIGALQILGGSIENTFTTASDELEAAIPAAE